MNFEEIMKILEKDGKIRIKKRGEKKFLIIIKNQGFSIEIQAQTIIIKGERNSNNSFAQTVEKAEEIKHILKKLCKEEIIIEIQ
ncbi:MAG: hypothetical protein AB7D02_02930 [Candidatus Paceibacterota bacterium]